MLWKFSIKTRKRALFFPDLFCETEPSSRYSATFNFGSLVDLIGLFGFFQLGFGWVGFFQLRTSIALPSQDIWV